MDQRIPPTGGLGGRGTPLVRVGWKAWLGICAMYLTGWALSALGGIVVLFVTMSWESNIGQLALFSLVTTVPALLIWVTSRGRYKHSLAAGLASSWIFTFWLVILWHPWSTMSGSEVDRATAQIRDAGTPAFYLGDQVGKFHWNDYYLADDQVNFYYGKCQNSDPDAGCLDWDVEVLNEQDSALGGDFSDGCKRLDPILGAPAVTLGGFGLDQPGDNIGIFTEKTGLFLRFADDDMTLEEKLAVAATLRPVGAAGATTLPPPNESVLADIERLCGPTP